MKSEKKRASPRENGKAGGNGEERPTRRLAGRRNATTGRRLAEKNGARRRNERVDREIERVAGRFIDDLLVESDADEARLGGERREETVVKPGAATEPSAVKIKGEAGNENDVERIRKNAPRRGGERLPNPERSDCQSGERKADGGGERVDVDELGNGSGGGGWIGRKGRRRVEPVKFEIAPDAKGNGDDAVRAVEETRQHRADRRFGTEIEVNAERLGVAEAGEVFEVAGEAFGDGDAVEDERGEAAFERLTRRFFSGGDFGVDGKLRGGGHGVSNGRGRGERKERRRYYKRGAGVGKRGRDVSRETFSKARLLFRARRV